ncbi:alpha/beta fold hydrolase [Candidatus Methylocalor cossyra]|uniref:AB hydrolase-1 domain-containing protein n=1 Tax=Candidatus Methylocalor cossyra TaxID=3108543 RepID=A0ABM9NHB8_9GAMM
MGQPEFHTVWAEVKGVPVYAVASVRPHPDAKPVVLVHGLGLSGAYLLPTARLLARDYWVWVPDLPGFGQSGKPAQVLDVGALAEALAEWMAAVGLPRAALLGNSFGCQIIVECAARHPQRVERAILQGPTTPQEERTGLWQFLRWRQNPNPGMTALVLRDYRAAGLDRVVKTFRYCLQHPMEERLALLPMPVLVVRGSRDPICRHGWAEELVQRLPQGRLVVIPGVHHTLEFTHPLELVRVCRPFLEGRALPATAERLTRPPQPSAEAPERPPLAQFDSASAMVRALGAYLDGRDFPLLGAYPAGTEAGWRALGSGVNAVPEGIRRWVYRVGGQREAVAPERLGAVRGERLAQWAVECYPGKRYPAAMVGSSNGALLHLAAALGIPWLPQTFLIPVRRGGRDPARPGAELDWGRGPGARLLAANPDLVLHHMHDPNQDYLMIQGMGYFRVKFRRLPPNYRRFLVETLAPGATLFSVECQLRWPTATVAERHVFQAGALGGLPPEAYERGGNGLAEFLARQGADPGRWDPPRPDGEHPEAEWGFTPELAEDLAALARQQGYRWVRVVFEHPEDPSPLVADFFRAWYRRRRLLAERLVVANFILMEPYWTLRTGSVPFWTVFDVEPSAARLESYLAGTDAYDEIYLWRFPHGVRSAGRASVERWRSVLARARKRGGFLGQDLGRYPGDFAALVRYHGSLPAATPARYPLPGPVSLGELDSFLERAGNRYAVRFLEQDQG